MKYPIKKGLSALLAIVILCLPCFVFASDFAEGSTTIVSDDYFNDAVFVGDSISLKLRKYVDKKREVNPDFLGKAQFLTTGGLGSGNVQEPITASSLHPRFQGQKMYLEDSVAATGAKKMYIMFGMNDIVPYGVDGAIHNLDILISKIQKKSPGIQIAVQSVTPIVESRQQRTLNNANIARYNERLKTYCQEKGFLFLDINGCLKNERGALPAVYCSDSATLGMHLSDLGCIPWIEYLRAHPFPSSPVLSTSAQETQEDSAVESDPSVSDEAIPESEPIESEQELSDQTESDTASNEESPDTDEDEPAPFIMIEYL